MYNKLIHGTIYLLLHFVISFCLNLPFFNKIKYFLIRNIFTIEVIITIE